MNQIAAVLLQLVTLASPAAWQESRLTDAVADALEAGRSADAEDLVRAELAAAPSPARELELGLVLVERANELVATSELGRSLRLAVLEEAIGHFRAARQDANLTADAVIGVASCEVQLDREQEAEATLRAPLDATATPPPPPVAVRRLTGELVRFLTLRGRADEARALIDAAAAGGTLTPGEVATEQLRITALRNDAPQAFAAAAAAAAATTAGSADRFTIAYLAWEAQSASGYESQLALFSRLLERFPDDLAFRYYRGATRLWMGDAAGARDDLAPCVDAPFVGERARAALGRALLRLERPDEALPWFLPLLERRGLARREALDGLVGVAVARARARRYADALALYQQALAVDPYNYWAHLGVPLCHRYLGDLDAAARGYEAGLAALPDEPQLLNDYGLLAHARGERQQASQLFERALAAGSADGGENLGIFALRDDDDAAVAANWFARALALDPSRPRVRFYRELCLTRLEGARHE